MLKFFRETKAYVSIFLCLVLLPMVTYSTMIIDATRLQSARVQVQSAGDLALNAAMSEYEQVLEDMYGLFANAKSKEDIEPAMRRYFEETISGTINNSSSNAKQQTYVAELADALTNYAMSGGTVEQPIPDGESTTNFLKMALAEDTEDNKAFSYGYVESSAISNPNIMKGQIIDYMKYKGPVSIGSNFLNKLGFLKDTKNQSTAVQKKVELTQDIADMDDPMKNAYQYIEEYNDNAEIYNTTYAGKDKLVTDINTMKSELDDISLMMLMRNNLKCISDERLASNNCQNFSDLSIEGTVLESEITALKSSDLHTAAIDLGGTATKLDSIISKLSDKIITITDENGNHNNLENGWHKISYTIKEEGDNEIKTENVTITIDNFGNGDNYDTFYIRYSEPIECVYPGKDELNIEEWKKFYNAQIEGLAKFDGAAAFMAEYKAYKEYFTELYNLYCERYQEYQSIYAEQNPDDDIRKDDTFVKYFKIYTLLEKLNAEINPTLLQGGLDKYVGEYDDFHAWALEYSVYEKPAESKCKKVAEEFNKYCSLVDNLVNNLNSASSWLGEIYAKAGGIESKATSIKNVEISNIEDDSIKSQMSSDIDTLAKSVDKEDIQKLKGVIDSYLTRFKGVQEKLKEIKYLSVGLYHFSGDFNNFNQNKKEYVIETGDRNAKVDSLWVTFIGKYPDRHEGYEEIIENNILKDDLNAITPKVTGKPEEEAFYIVLKNTHEAKAPESNEENEETENNLKSITNSAKVGSDGKPAQTIEIKPKEESQPTTEAVAFPENSSGNQGTFSAAHNEIAAGESDGYGQADDASVPDKDTDADDAKDKAGKGKENLEKANTLLKNIANIAENMGKNVYLEEYFTEMFTCLTDKKLAPGELELINGYSNNSKAAKYLNTKNAWYGNEIEYILWGKENLQDNLNTTAMTIFLLRFAINAVYAFTASDIQGMASSMANLLVGWTVVLVPVVQVCIVLAVALAESALDLAMLQNGDDVPLIKDKTTFICSPSGFISSVADKVIDYAIEEVADYATNKVDEAIDAALEKGKETVGACEAEITTALSQYLDQQMASITTAISAQFTGPLVSAMTPMISKIQADAGNIVTDTGTLAGDTVDTVFATIKGNIDNMNDGITKTFAKKVFEEANNKKSDMVNEIKDKLQGEINKISAESLANLINNKINFWINGNNNDSEIRKELENKLKETTGAMKTNIMKHAGDAATSLKGYLHEEIGKASQELSGTAKEFVKDNISQVKDKAIKGTSSSLAAKVTMNYKEYCKVFTFIGLMSDENEAKMLKRAAVLMQLNVTYAVKGGGTVSKAGTDNFHMNNAYTLFYVDANIEMGTLFPWAVKFEDNNGTGGNASLDLTHLGTNSVNLKYTGIAGY